MDAYQKFSHPDEIYHGTDFWMLNGLLEEDEIVRQLTEMQKQGVRSFIARTYLGLVSDYPGPDFKCKLKVIIETAKRLGMKLFLQACYMPEHVPNLPIDYALNYIYVVKEKDVLPQWRIICKYNGLVFCENPISNTLDMFNTASMEYYLKTSYEEAWKDFADEYGKTIISVWVDEPSYSCDYLPYPNHIEEEFFKRWGYSLPDNLYKLYYDIDNYKTVRYHYHKLIQDLLESHYFKMVQEWCHGQGLKASGHLMLEDKLSWQISRAGAVMPYYKYFDLPGIDVLRGEMNWNSSPLYPDGYLPYSYKPEMFITPKQCVSAAKQAGKEHILCEMYAVTTQDMSFRNQKYMFDYLAAQGINHRCVHGVFYSLKGRAKRAYPPQVNYYQPYFNDLHIVYDYVATVSQFISLGKPCADVLIIHPLDSAFCCYSPRSAWSLTGIPISEKTMRERDEEFFALTKAMSLSNVPFDFGDERTIESCGKIKNGEFIVGNTSYRTVVLPNLWTLQKSTLDLLKKFARNGGRIIAVGDEPYMIDGVESTSKLFEGIKVEHVIKINDLPDLLGNKNYKFIDKCGFYKTIISERKDNFANYYFLFNTDCATERQGVFSVKGCVKAELWDGLTKERRPICGTYDGQSTNFDIVIPEGGSLMLYSTKGEPLKSDNIEKPVSIMKLPCTWAINRKNKNALLLEFCRYKKGNGVFSSELPILAVHKRLVADAYRGKLTIRFQFESEFEAEGLAIAIEDAEKYSICFNGINIPKKIDGYYLERHFKTVLLPKSTVGKNIIDLTVEYEPLSELKSVMGALYEARSGVELESAYLIGDFAVSTIKEPCFNGDLRYSKNMKLIKERGETFGELTSVGYPFYAGSIEMENSFEFSGEKGQIYLQMEWLNACVCHVEINDIYCGTVFAAPYEINVSKAVKKGRNKLKLTFNNTLRNLLGPYHRPRGEMGCLFSTYADTDGPWIWDPNSDPKWQENRFIDHSSWTDSYLCVPFGVSDVKIKYY